MSDAAWGRWHRMRRELRQQASLPTLQEFQERQQLNIVKQDPLSIAATVIEAMS